MRGKAKLKCDAAIAVHSQALLFLGWVINHYKMFLFFFRSNWKCGVAIATDNFLALYFTKFLSKQRSEWVYLLTSDHWWVIYTYFWFSNYFQWFIGHKFLQQRPKNAHLPRFALSFSVLLNFFSLFGKWISSFIGWLFSFSLNLKISHHQQPKKIKSLMPVHGNRYTEKDPPKNCFSLGVTELYVLTHLEWKFILLAIKVKN